MINIKDKAIRNIYPQSVITEWENNSSVDIEPIDAWDKDDNVIVLDKNKIKTEMARLQAEYDAQEYARNRQAEYPSTGDQLDYIFHNGVSKWKTDIIEPVKTKWPKDNSGPVEEEESPE